MMDPSKLVAQAARIRGAALARLDPKAAQLKVLRRLLATSSRTRFGRAHGFAAMRGLADYQRNVPLRDWSRFWREWWEPAFPVLSNATWPGRIPFFAETSGTTSGITKHIPVSAAMIASNRRAAFDVAFAHLRQFPRSGFFGGPSLILGGSTSLTRLAPGVRSGDLSGIAAATMPAWTSGRALPSRNVALLADWDRKLASIVTEAAGRDLRTMSGTPSWLLILFERLLENTGATTLDALFPHLEVVIHGGVGFGPYRTRFEALLGRNVRTREVYPASEGFIAYQDEDETCPAEVRGALRLLLDNGIFLEFVKLADLDRPNPTRLWVGNAETGCDYALVLTTNAGLFSYILGDVVRIVARDPLRVVVVGRTSQMLSAFGEHVSGGELDRAIETAANACGVSVPDYAASVVPPDGADPRGGHLFVIETASSTKIPTHADEMATILDRVLADNNADYAAHRRGDHGMRPPTVRLVPAGFFADWMQRRGKLGGQNKVPRIITDPDLLASLLGCIPDPQHTPDRNFA